MIFRLLPAIALAVSCLGRGCGCRPAPAERLQLQPVAAIEPSSSDPPRPLSDGPDNHDDRHKRQLSSVQSKLLNFLKPLPVVDVTKEEDKYGNDGDKFNRIGRSFVGGVEKVSSVLTSALSFPVDTAKKISRGATEMLNNIGGRLVGLQR